MPTSENFLDFYKGKRVVVTGGGGFLGSRIVAILEGAGVTVSVPRRAEGTSPVRNPEGSQGVSISNGVDFRRSEDCNNYFEKTKPEIVVNCAAWQGGIGFHSGKQGDLFMDNMRMGLFLMEAAQKSGVKKFVNVVAGCSYPGYTEKDELIEEDYWNGKIHESIFSYGFPRKASVEYGLALKKQYNFNSIHLIMANMYGPGEHFGFEQSKALAGLLRKVYEAKKSGAPSIEIWGTGKPVRDWLYVEDGAEGILRAGAAYDEVEPLNIGSGTGVSVTELAEMIKKIIGYGGALAYNTSKQDGALRKIFGVHKLEEKLHWLPKTQLEDGIKKTAEWFDKNYDYAIVH